jgi:hypothetical protein
MLAKDSQVAERRMEGPQITRVSDWAESQVVGGLINQSK